MIMKKIVLFALLVLLLAGCKSKKPTAEAYKGDVEVEIPCTGKEYQSDKKAFRALAEGYSTDMTIARNKAMTTARADLASQINILVQRVVESYGSSYQMGADEEAKSKFQDMTRQSVEQALSGAVVICDKTMRTKDNKYRVYIVMEVNGNDLASEIANKVKDDDKLRIDYEYEKFKKLFDEEMNKR